MRQYLNEKIQPKKDDKLFVAMSDTFVLLHEDKNSYRDRRQGILVHCDDRSTILFEYPLSITDAFSPKIIMIAEDKVLLTEN